MRVVHMSGCFSLEGVMQVVMRLEFPLKVFRASEPFRKFRLAARALDLS